MSSWEMKIIAAEAGRLIAMSARDAGLRDALRALARDILEATEAPPPEAAAEGTGAVEATEGSGHPGPGEDETTAEGRGPGREPLRELTLGRRVEPVAPPRAQAIPARRVEPDRDDRESIARRCRAKSSALRRQVECHRRVWEGVDTPVEEADEDPEMREWAGRMVDCFYWLDDESAHSSDLALLDDVAGCFEVVAEALDLLPAGAGRRGEVERALILLAEGQSMLRRALRRLRAPDDPDQMAVYQLVRDEAARHRIFLRRYMRAEDLADPSGWPGLLSRIEAVATGGPHSRQQAERLDRLRGDLERLSREGDGEPDWGAVVEAVEGLIDDGMPPSRRELRDLLLPVIDDLPDRDDWPPGFRRVLREIDRHLATRTAHSRGGTPPAPPTEVERAARLLGGRGAVLIGGIRRPEAQASLKSALGLRELIWIETREHQSIASFEPVIARPDVALVLLAIRWSSHSFGDVRQYCVRYGKPLVRLPGGYGAHQVAVQVLAQASEALGDVSSNDTL